MCVPPAPAAPAGSRAIIGPRGDRDGERENEKERKRKREREKKEIAWKREQKFPPFIYLPTMMMTRAKNSIFGGS